MNHKIKPFKTLKYHRPNIDLFEKKLKKYISDLHHAESYTQQENIILQIRDLRIEFETPIEIAWVRHSINTRDFFYKKEKGFIDDYLPVYDNLMNGFFEVLLASSFRKELEKRFGKRIFVIAETSLKRISPAISKDQQAENKLKSQYNEILASCNVMFQGKKRTISELTALESSLDRETRKQAAEAKFAFFAEHQREFDTIFDDMVHLRQGMSKKMGLNDYVELGYLYRNRSDYTPDMVANLRNEVHQHITPLVIRLMKDQADRLNVDQLFHYDESCRYPNGNAQLAGDTEQTMKSLQTMYSEMAEETKNFFDHMMKFNMMDIKNRPGKEVGAYCNCITQYDTPFIFTNFNGTDDDIRVFTHESGHAFQVYSSGKQDFIEYIWPTFDAGEIPSMSMEFFTWPWMELFFGKDAEKYRYAHFVKSLAFLPYGCAVDEFQHRVYENPNLTPLERHQVWKDIEMKFMPFRNYDGLDYLEMGGFWQKQWHIYKTPFYYIDYVIAQICSFQFWQKAQTNYDDTWQDYFTLCKMGGQKTLNDLLSLANLDSPFETGVVESVVKTAKDYLNQIDPKNL